MAQQTISAKEQKQLLVSRTCKNSDSPIYSAITIICPIIHTKGHMRTYVAITFIKKN